MRRVLVMAVLCLLATSAWAQDPTPMQSPSQPAAQDAKQELKQLTEQYIAALKGKDTATLERIWADDLTFINPDGVLLTKAQRLANIQSGATRFDSIEPTSRTVRVYGDTAVINGLTTLKGHYSGKRHGGQYRTTQVLVRRDGQWQIVALQMTPVATTMPAEKKP